MAKSERILVCGDVEGKLAQLFKRVDTINQKNGPFSMLLCVGEFFGTNENEWKQYLEGKFKVPIPTYILGPNSLEMSSNYPDMKGCELAENLIYLGPYGVYPCSSGLRIAYLSGKDSKVKVNTQSKIGFTLDDVKNLELCAGSNPRIDILITNEWPKGVSQFAKSPDGIDVSKAGSLLVSRLGQKLKPRYHFAGSEGVFYERLPYRNHEVLQESAVHVTRFIALAKVGNSRKQKWIYAFNATPMVHSSPSELVSQPSDVTEHPYPKDLVYKAEQIYSNCSQGAKGNQFFYDMNSKGEDDRRKGRKRKNRYQEDSEEGSRRPQQEPKGPCWFCLASPEVEKHLVVSVGTYSYLALAKGGLVSEHLLILPIEHFQSTSVLDDESRAEIEKFKSTLKEMFKAKDKSVVFFERNYRTQHLQIQVVPIPSKFSTHLKETFTDMSEDSDIKLEEVPQFSDIAQMAPPGTPFFFVELPNGDKLFHRIRKGFPLNFGRELLACPPLLNIPERVDWRECKLSKEKETELRNEIRNGYQPFDFTLEEDESDDDSD